MGSSERVQVSVAGYLSLRPEVRSGVGRCSGGWSARDPETGWGCFTDLTLECPVLVGFSFHWKCFK